MPKISRFYGIIIAMYLEVGNKHHLPHSHATYQQWRAAFSIKHIEISGGYFPKKQKRLVEAWAEIHQDELQQAWAKLQNGHPADRIAPLE